MTGSSLVRGVILLGFCSLAGGCAGATWKGAHFDPSYKAPKQLNVAIVVQAKGEDVTEAVRVMREALSAELKNRGIAASFNEVSAVPASAELSVIEWVPGSQVLRYLVGFGAGAAAMVVVVKSPSVDGQPGLSGEVRGWVKSGMLGGNATNAASLAGQSIGKAIATGEAD